jgi:GntR family phosphonate transport system transcriptional regulator
MTDTIPRGAGITLWRQIAEHIAADIAAGRLRAEEQLDNEQILAARFGVNRHTLRRAMAMLAEQGLLRVEQGRGTFVASAPIDYLLGRRTRFAANLQAQGLSGSHRLLSAAPATASPALAADLGLKEGASVLRLETLGLADEVTLSYAIHNFPLPRFAGLEECARADSLTEAMAALGVTDYTRRVTRLLARLPTATEARHLNQSPHRPVLQADAVNVDADGTPTHHSLTVFAGDRVQMVVPG